MLWSAAENMVKWRQAHADLEAHEKATDNHFVNKMCVNLEEGNVIDGQSDEQKQAEYVRPYVDLLKREREKETNE